MQEVLLHKVWKNLTYRYMSEDHSYKLWKEIVKYYSKRNRHYHTLRHISDMIQKYYFTYEENLKNPDEVLFAIFYHDIIYKTTRSDNELQSAVFMDARLKDTELSEKQLSFIFECIQSTKKHELSDNQDINYLLDMDMAILGQPWSEYNKYINSVRKEYRIYPSFMYNKGRKEVLRKFLSQERIFNTNNFFKSYEKSARENIERELKLYE